jgi:hypothetical protein
MPQTRWQIEETEEGWWIVKTLWRVYDNNSKPYWESSKKVFNDEGEMAKWFRESILGYDPVEEG